MKRINIDFVKKVSLIVLVCILLFVASFSRPYKVQADPISAIALGTGALGALVASYFATAGVTLSGNSDTDGSFLSNYVANWVKSSSSFPNNAYFNSSGEFIGNNTDLSIVQNNDTGLVSFIFGKAFAIWLEALKQSFVSEKNLEVGVDTSLVSNDVVIFDNVSYPVFLESSGTVLNFMPSSIVDLTSFTTTSFNLPNNRIMSISINDTSSNLIQVVVRTNTNSNLNSLIHRYTISFNKPVLSELALGFYIFNDGSLGICSIRNNPYWSDPIQILATYKVFDISNTDYALSVTPNSISAEGTLTDGYEDFEEAINQDLTNADEDEVAVVDVGTFPDILNPTDLIDEILDRITDKTLVPTYDGTRENTESAEEEKEGNKPFVPQYPSDWVVVNGIQSFFPFCIPWDLAYIIGLLQAEPVAPNFTWVMDFGKYADPYTIHIDLAPFETVAIVFRTMIVFLFLIFLIKKSRDLIRG